MLIHTISFNVKGVTFKNEEGEEVQEEIKKILKGYKDNDYFDSLYGGYTNSEIKEMDLNVSEYEGEVFPVKLIGDMYNNEECLKVYFKTYNDEYVHIGYAPKDKLKEISEWLNKKELKVDSKLEVVGGKYKHTEFYEEDYEGKEKVVVEELTYGIQVTLSFCDNQVSPEYIKMKEEENRIKKQQDIEKNISIVVWIIVLGVLFWIFSKLLSCINWLFE